MTAMLPIYHYRRFGDGVYMYGLSSCPLCEKKRCSVSERPIGDGSVHEFTCDTCGGSWPAKVVDDGTA